MNQKGFVSVFLIILVVALAGIGGYFAFTKLSPRTQPLPSTQNSTQNSEKPLLNNTGEVKFMSVTECESVTDQEKSQCYNKLGQINKSVADCDKIGFFGYKNYCYEGVAIGTQDNKVCDKINNPSQPKADIDSCYEKVAIFSGDLKECDKLKNPDRWQYAWEYCYAGIAATKKDITICQQLTSEKPYCIVGVAVAKQDIALCGQAHFGSNYDEYEKASSCYEPIAVAKKDKSVCDNLKQGASRDSCYSKVAVAKGDASDCEKLPNTPPGNSKYDPARDYCFYGLATKTTNDSLCEKISPGTEKDACYQSIGQKKLDIAICDKITDAETKGTCYYRVAIDAKNIAVCDKWALLPTIKIIPNAKNVCYQAVSGGKLSSPTSNANNSNADPLLRARNEQRFSNVNALAKAIGKRAADNQGVFEKNCIAGPVPTTPAKMASGGSGNYNIAPCLVPLYISLIPNDPAIPNGHYTDSTDYDSNYYIVRNAATGRITVSAPGAEGQPISVEQ